MAQYTITEEQIKKLSKQDKIVEEYLKEWFPKAFNPKVEIGKWYKHPNGNLLFIKSIKNTGVYGYGFDVFGNWVNCTDESSLAFICDLEILKHLDKAKIQLVKTALIAEAKRRGFVDGAKYKSPNGKFKRTVVYPLVLTNDGKDLKDSHCSMLTYRGQWAEIIKEKILSKSEAEAKLKELSKDGFEYKIIEHKIAYPKSDGIDL